jgi:hypothetical protein
MIRDATLQPPFADLMGMKITHVSRDKVTAEMLVRDQLENRMGVLHGGAVMAFADNLGGTATIANLPDGARTATIESKPISSPRSRSATPPTPNARRCTRAAAPWSGRPASPATTASSAPLSPRRRSSFRPARNSATAAPRCSPLV